MSYECHCQFCDKSIISENLATIVEGYITCGSSACMAKAISNTKEFAAEAAAKVEYKGRMVVFSTLTPEDDSTWRIVKQKDHPKVLRNVEVMSQMKIGHYVFDEETKLYYSAKTTSEVVKQSRESVKEAEDNE